jgi:16S rRNA processing protein RimM
MAKIQVGRVGRPHGVQGEVAVDGVTLTADELLAVERFTWRGPDRRELALVLASARPALQRMLLRFEGYGDRDRAQELGRGELWVEREALPDPGPGVAYTFQLIGLAVRTEEGRDLGKVVDIVQTGAHPVYTVRDGDGRERLLPAPPEFVRAVDLTAGTIVMALPAGLDEL